MTDTQSGLKEKIIMKTQNHHSPAESDATICLNWEKQRE